MFLVCGSNDKVPLWCDWESSDTGFALEKRKEGKYHIS
jgi:hypothetical protein